MGSFCSVAPAEAILLMEAEKRWCVVGGVESDRRAIGRGGRVMRSGGRSWGQGRGFRVLVREERDKGQRRC